MLRIFFRYFPLALLGMVVTVLSRDVVAQEAKPSLEAKPTDLGQFSGVELFLDDEVISWSQNLVRQIRTPEKFANNPILRSEFPWESLYCTLHGTVMYDPAQSRFRMWYNAIGEDYRKQHYLAYAESDDGFVWRKPLLNLVPYGEHKETNILLGRDVNIHGPCLLMNPREGTDQKYLVLFDSYTHLRPNAPERQLDSRAIYAATSTDGLHFTPETGRMILLGKSDTGHSAVWNPERQRIQLYLRGVNEYVGANGGRQRVRYVRYSESPDAETWSNPIEMLRANEKEGAPDVQIHQLSVTRYGNAFLGLMTLFHINRLEFNAMYRGEKFDILEHGVTETQLVFSRDGLHWSRVADRQTFLPRGSPGQWDSGWIVTASNLLIHGDEVRIYYAGAPNRYSLGQTAIGVATCPVDRFVALKPQRLNVEGILETKPLLYTSDLVLNADAAKGGEIRTEVLDFSGKVLPGFERITSTPIQTDSLRHPLCWGERTVPDAIAANSGKPVRLRFYLRNALLYSLRQE